VTVAVTVAVAVGVSDAETVAVGVGVRVGVGLSHAFNPVTVRVYAGQVPSAVTLLTTTTNVCPSSTFTWNAISGFGLKPESPIQLVQTLFGSKLPRYAAVKMKRGPVHAAFVSIVTHWVEPVVLVKVYAS
jgi:hypothetical protein